MKFLKTSLIMKPKYRAEFIDIDKLQLDNNNPRFAELYEGDEDESGLINYLLLEEAAEEVLKGILKVGDFYEDEKLWVIQESELKYLVKDGNRRCAAVKALQNPKEYGLPYQAFKIEKLPVLVYEDKDELDKRITEQHTASLFREWERIAKALKVYDMYTAEGGSQDLQEIDSKPYDLVRLASFYFEAVKIGGTELKKLLRKGRGKTGGKTTIFERLFKFRKLCGYHFQRGPSYRISVDDKEKFETYIQAMVDLLTNDSTINYKHVDDEGEGFLLRLKEYGFDYLFNDGPEQQKFDIQNNEDETEKCVDNKRQGNNNSVNPPKKTSRSKEEDILFGMPLSLKSGKTNDLYRAIDSIYSRFKGANSLDNILPVIGISLRLLLEVAGREYFTQMKSELSKKDQLLDEFIKVIKKEFKKNKAQEKLSYIALTNDWLDGSKSIEGILGKWAHGNMSCNKSEILNISKVVGDILNYYFKK